MLKCPFIRTLRALNILQTLLNRCHNPIKKLNKPVIRDINSVNAKTFIDLNKMRRCKKTCLITTSLKKKRHHFCNRTFTICPRNMHCLILFIRIPQPLKKNLSIIHLSLLCKPRNLPYITFNLFIRIQSHHSYPLTPFTFIFYHTLLSPSSPFPFYNTYALVPLLYFYYLMKNTASILV